MNLKEITNYIGIEQEDKRVITGLNTLIDANPNELTFLENKKYIKQLSSTKAGAVLVTKEFKELVPKDTIALICEEPYICLAKISKLFAPNIIQEEGKEPLIPNSAKISKNVYIGYDTEIGENAIIMPGVFIGDNVKIGNNAIIYPNTSIYRDCVIGNNCTIHAGTVIGSDGFGFASTKEGKYIKIYQNGNVVIGNDVEIGANTAIDRAVFSSTIIENGVRLDNLVHIAHNCKIGSGSILVAQVGLAGSTKLGSYVVMGGQSGSAGHLEVAPFTTIAGRGGISKSIKIPKKSWAGFPLMEHRTWLKLQGKITKLLK